MNDVDPSIDDSVDGTRLADVVLQLLSFDTSNPPGRTDEIVDWIEGYLNALDLDTTRVTTDPQKPNILTQVPGSGAHTVLYLGHLDTVPFQASSWDYNPLGERVADRIYGRGATDMKGPVASMLEAVRLLAKADARPPVTVELAFVSDEEIAGGAGLPAILDADVVDAAACVIGETTSTDGHHSVTVADRGYIWVTLEARGHAAHGSRPMFGTNAIDRLYRAIEELRADLVDHVVDYPPAIEPLIEESIAYYADIIGERAARHLFERPTVNLGQIEGGESFNTVPATARAEIDIRIAPGAEPRAVLADVQSCTGRCEGVEIADAKVGIGTYQRPDDPLVEAVVAAADGVGGQRVYRRSATGGGDSKRLREENIPTVEFAFGTETAHAVDEYIPIEALRQNAAVYRRLPHELDAHL